ncbi:MAG: hypothetical protein MN733_24850, partial [Nitrososphaera sp.]|nr:hypothetical protein [Nitrososphaera sp.]
MTPFLHAQIHRVGRQLSPADRIALAILSSYLLLTGLQYVDPRIPGARFVSFLAFLALGYFLIRLLYWSRRHLLWSLRNRLIIAYLFIAVVPVLLLLSMALLSAYIIYSQLGAYLLYDEFQRRIEDLQDAAGATASTIVAGANSATHPKQHSASVEALIAARQTRLPGIV